MEDDQHKKTREEVIRSRDDLSTFLVHLTKDTEDGTKAKENLKSILQNQRIEKRNPKGLLYTFSEFIDCSKSVCFTETPINYIKHLTNIEGRDVVLEPYGIVFSKEKALMKGVNPVFYINTYSTNTTLRDAFYAIKSKCNLDELKAIVPYLEIFGKMKSGGSRDFSWEREWRYNGDFVFENQDIVVGLVKTKEEISEFETEFKSQYPNIKFITPDFSIEELILKLAGK